MNLNVYSQLEQKTRIEHLKNKSLIRIKYPSNLKTARKLGYKNKPGYFLVRIRIKKGSRIGSVPNAARRTKHSVPRYTLKISNKQIAKNRVARKYKALEVLNAYKVEEFNAYNYFEVILYDPNLILKTNTYKGKYSFRSAT